MLKTSSLINTIKSIKQDIDNNSAKSLASLCLSIFTSQKNAEDFITQNLCLSDNVEDIIGKLKALQISNIQQAINPHTLIPILPSGSILAIYQQNYDVKDICANLIGYT